MTEDFERGLRNRLQRASEGLSDNPARYDEVARRVRRRRTGAIAGLTSAVVLLAAIGGFVVVNGGSGDGGGDKTELAGDPPLDMSCPAPSGGPGKPKDTGTGPWVSTGAVAARLCPGTEPKADVPPADLRLTTLDLRAGVGEVVAKLNALPAAKPDPICTMDLGPTYDLLLGYPDGRRVTVTFESFGCGVARSGEEYRLGAGQLDDFFRELAAKKPKAPSAQPSDLTCPPPSGGVDEPKDTGGGPLVPTGAVGARMCPATDELSWNGASVQGVELRRGVDRLVEKINKLGAARPGPCIAIGGGPSDLLLLYPDGRKITVTFDTSGCGYAQSGDEFRVGARGLGEAFRELAAAQDPTTPGETGTCPPASGGVGTPKDTGAGQFVRPGATTALICPGYVGSDRPAPDQLLVGKTATSGLDLLVRKLNALKAVGDRRGGLCRGDLGPTYDLVLGYPDGSTAVVTFDTFGCGFAKSGSGFRQGARDLAEYFAGMLAPLDLEKKAPIGRLVCPPPSGGPKPGTSGGPAGNLVEQGANLAELCPARPSDPVPDGFDPLVNRGLRERVGELVDWLNALPAPSGSPACDDDLGPLYDLVLSYPDGHTQVVKIQTYGCGDVESNGRFRTSAREFKDHFAELLEKQRINSPPTQPNEPGCPMPTPGSRRWSGDHGSLAPYAGKLVPYPAVEAVACRFEADHRVGALPKMVPIPQEKAEQLRALVNASVKSAPTCEVDGYPVDTISFADNANWESGVVIGRDSCVAVQGEHAAGTASPELLRELDELLG